LLSALCSLLSAFFAFRHRKHSLNPFRYRRWENNGWRPISEKLLSDDDPVVKESAGKTRHFHYSKLVTPPRCLPPPRPQPPSPLLSPMYEI
jgi:hypothetical protein